MDDITWIGGNYGHAIDRLKQLTPGILQERDLLISVSKTEEYAVCKGENIGRGANTRNKHCLHEMI